MKLVGSEDGYKTLVKTMLQLSDEDFPVALSREDPMDLTVSDIKDFIDEFKKDTGLSAAVHLSECDRCDKLHMSIVINKDEEYNYGKLHLVQ